MHHNSIPVSLVPFNVLIEPPPVSDANDVTRLAESIATEGVCMPLVVVAHEAGFSVMAGKRRYWAICRLIADPECPDWHRNSLVPVAVVDPAKHAEFV